MVWRGGDVGRVVAALTCRSAAFFGTSLLVTATARFTRLGWSRGKTVLAEILRFVHHKQISSTQKSRAPPSERAPMGASGPASAAKVHV